MLRTTIYTCTAFTLLVSGTQAAEFMPLGNLPAAGFESSAADVSDDGSVVVGQSSYSSNNQNGSQAFRWTADTGMVGLGHLPDAPNLESSASGVSADGSVVVGESSSQSSTPPASRTEAFRWTSAGGMIGLGSLVGPSRIISEADSVSANGKVIVGNTTANGARPDMGRFHHEAFSWTSVDGMIGLGDLSGDNLVGSSASGASADGSVVVGESETGFTQAFRWTEAGGMVGLGFLPGDAGSGAQEVNADGSVVVGWSQGDDIEAFRWTSAGGMLGLGHLPGGNTSRATGVSADGNIVVGNDSEENSAGDGFVWTQADGMQRLEDILEANGTTGLDGWNELSVASISANGRWVVGQGLNPSGFREAFLVQLRNSVSQDFQINPGLNGSWANFDTLGQGFFIDVLPEIPLIFFAWFTWETDQTAPAQNESQLQQFVPSRSRLQAVVGDDNHRWLTAQGAFSGNTAELDVTLTTGGLFDDPQQATNSDPGTQGTITLTFDDCKTGTVDYNFTAIGLSGSVPIRRLAEDNVEFCETMDGIDDPQ